MAAALHKKSNTNTHLSSIFALLSSCLLFGNTFTFLRRFSAMRNQYENLLLLLVLSTPAFPQQFAIHYGPTHMERF